jgi:hypothetical protein
VNGAAPQRQQRRRLLSGGNMALVTWLGEDTEREPGPSYNTWNGIRFPKGEPVEIADEHMIEVARTNQFYRVEEQDEKKVQEIENDLAQEDKKKLKAALEREEFKKTYHYKDADKVSGYTPKKKRAKAKPKHASGGAGKIPGDEGRHPEGPADPVLKHGADNEDQDADRSG